MHFCEAVRFMSETPGLIVQLQGEEVYFKMNDQEVLFIMHKAANKSGPFNKWKQCDISAVSLAKNQYELVKVRTNFTFQDALTRMYDGKEMRCDNNYSRRVYTILNKQLVVRDLFYSSFQTSMESFYTLAHREWYTEELASF